MSEPTTCPNACNLTGPEIPEESRHLYGNVTHYSRLIGVDGGRLGIYDGVIWWACPECGARWHRFTGDDPKDRRIRRAVESAWAKS